MSKTLPYKKMQNKRLKEIYYIISGTVCLRAGSLYMSTDDLRGQPQGMILTVLRLYTAVRSLRFNSDRETTDSVLHLLVLKIILEIACDVASTRIQDQSIGLKSEK